MEETLCILEVTYFNAFINAFSSFAASGRIVETKRNTVSVEITKGFKKGTTLVVDKDSIVNLVTINLN